MPEMTDAVVPTQGQGEPTSSASAPVNQTPVTTNVTTEKSSKTPDVHTDSGNASDELTKTVPYSRFKELNDRLKAFESYKPEELQGLKDKAALLDKLSSDPESASAFLKNMPKASEGSTVLQKAEEQLLQRGFVKLEKVQEMVEQALESREFNNRVVNRFTELEKKYDGSNGLPKFVAKDVADYLDKFGFTYDDNGFPDIEKSFKMMNLDHFAQALAKENKSTAYSEKPGQPGSSNNEDSEYQAALERARKTGNWKDVILQKVKNPFTN